MERVNMYITVCGNATHPVTVTVPEGRRKFPLMKTQLDCHWSLVANPNQVSLSYTIIFHIELFTHKL